MEAKPKSGSQSNRVRGAIEEERLPLSRVLEAELLQLQPQQSAGVKARLEKLGGDDEAGRLTAIRVAARDAGATALCLSGGGIRSATFSLGVIQELARRKLLGGFHYLSTVSGGGYIGSWLSAWIRHKTLPVVLAELETTSRAGTEAEPAPIRHLRAYSNYLSPKLGILSADTWTLAATFLRNLLIHWSLLLPLLMAALMLPSVGAAVVRLAVMGAMPGAAVIAPAALGVALFAAIVGIAYVECGLPSAGGARLTERQFFVLCLMPLAVSTLGLMLYWAIQVNLAAAGGVWRAGAASGGLPPLLALAAIGAGVHLAGWGLGVAARGPLRATFESGLGVKLLSLEAPRIRDVAFVAGSGALGGSGLWWVAAKVFPAGPGWDAFTVKLYLCTAAPLLLALFFLATTAYVGLASRTTNEDDREWWARAGAWVLIAAVSWLVASGLVLFGPSLMRMAGGWATSGIAAAGGIAGVAAAVAGYLSKNGIGKTVRAATGIKSALAKISLNAAALVFLVVLTIGLASAVEPLVGFVESAVLRAPPASEPRPGLDLAAEAILLVGFALVGAGLASAIGINKFSLHTMYGNRLVRAHLAASRDPSERQPNPFTGFDPADSVQMKELLLTEGQAKPEEPPVGGRRLFHVVNVALNLVAGEQLSWQQRKAESFTISPLHAGSSNPSIGYRPSERYSDLDNGISLAKAMTISGAAASPNMGYHSSTLVAFLMNFFNVRLGWWLGNPGPHGARTWFRNEPRFALRPLIAEAFGLTDDTSPYVYLSDGGHFDNLGLYEMVLRRCRHIVVVDASCDPEAKYEDLVDAVRKIRADLGIPIELESLPKKGDGAEGERQRYRIGRILYTEVDGPDAPEGRLLYVKPIVVGSEPLDVQKYAEGHVKPGDVFPHQSTGDQFFDEAQFESYRMLGRHTIARIVDRALEEVAGRMVAPASVGELVETLARKDAVAAPEPSAAAHPTEKELLARFRPVVIGWPEGGDRPPGP